MSNDTIVHGCTVVTTATGGRCGWPAIASFVSARTGDTLYECIDHALMPSIPEHAPDAVGATVVVTRGKFRGITATITGTTEVHLDLVSRYGTIMRVRRDSVRPA